MVGVHGDDSVYLAGSHGAGRKSGKLDPSRLLVYRLPVNDEGEPDFDISKDEVAKKIERKASLFGIIESDEKLDDFAGKKLDENGANIEGLGILGNDLYFGFRAPVGPSGAVILKVGVETLFGDANEMAESFFVDLGAGYGIRDIAFIDDRFLLLAGAAQDVDLVPAIWSWAPDTDPRLLRILDVPGSRKAEGLMVLDWKDNKEIRVLVLFDSEKNGAPAEFTIPFQ